MPRRFLKAAPVPEITWPAVIRQSGSEIPSPAERVTPGTNNAWGSWTAVLNSNAPGVNFVACMFCVNFVYSREFQVVSNFLPLYRYQAGVGPAGSERVIAEIATGHVYGLTSLANSYSGTSTSATTGPPGTMTDTTQNWPVNGFNGMLVTSGGKTITVAGNTANVITGAAGWSGGGDPGAAAYTIGGKVTVSSFMGYYIPLKPILIPTGSRLAFRGTTEDSNALAITGSGCELVGYDADKMPTLIDERTLWLDDEPYAAGGARPLTNDLTFRQCVWPFGGSGVADEGKVIIPSIPPNLWSPWVDVILPGAEPYTIIIDGVVLVPNPGGGLHRGVHIEIGIDNLTYSRAYFPDLGGGLSALSGGYQQLCRPLLVAPNRRVSVRGRTSVGLGLNNQVVLTGERVGR